MGRISLLVIIALLGLTACNTTPPENPASPLAADLTPTATAIPPVSILTATPTSTRSPVTPTRTSPPPTSTPIPTPTPYIYTVEQYDTLLDIALQFDITVEDLLAANDIGAEEFLQLGQELVIPLPTPTLVPTATATLSATIPAGQTASPTLDSASDPAIASSSPTPPAPPGGDTPPPAEAAAPPPTSTPSGPPPPTVTHAAGINPLTGLAVDDPAKLQRRPLLVRIGNDVGARQSQVGLNSADMVYEEITEWWVTRFTAIFLAETPNTVGPVRSARLINIQLVPQYQGALAHSGGSDPVRWEISQAPIANLDEYYNPSPYFYRPGEGWQTRLAIDTGAARNYMTTKGLETAVPLQGFLFSESLAEGEPAENIYIPYPQATSFTEWHYDPGSGQYLRWINGAPLTDVNSGQVAAANVIIYFAEHQPTDIVEDANGATSIRILVNGKGPAWFFRDGQLNRGFWETNGSRTPYFAYEDGRPYALKPGNTWVEVVPTYYTIGLNSPDEASSR